MILTIPVTEAICVSVRVTSYHGNESEAYQTHSQYYLANGQPKFRLQVTLGKDAMFVIGGSVPPQNLTANTLRRLTMASVQIGMPASIKDSRITRYHETDNYCQRYLICPKLEHGVERCDFERYQRSFEHKEIDPSGKAPGGIHKMVGVAYLSHDLVTAPSNLIHSWNYLTKGEVIGIHVTISAVQVSIFLNSACWQLTQAVIDSHDKSRPQCEGKKKACQNGAFRA